MQAVTTNNVLNVGMARSTVIKRTLHSVSEIEGGESTAQWQYTQ
jgi:hypothetical protein